MKSPVIYVVSDSLGETAEFVARAAASQFNGGKFEIRRVPYVNEKILLQHVVEEASTFPSVIVYTLVVPGLKEELERLSLEYEIPVIDVLGPTMQALAQITSTEPKLQVGLLHRMDEEYFRKVEAIEFAVKYDDGKDPRGLMHADVVLIGVSRTSKTPVCMYLAHKRIKAANVPLVPEVAPPVELFKIPSRKIIALVVRPEVLHQVRKERLIALGLTTDAEYANLNRISQELEYANRLVSQLGCPVVDVTNKAVEETASKVLEIFYKGERDGKREEG